MTDENAAAGGGVNVLALCAGYGGLELGVHLATSEAARCVCYVEREAAAAAVLVKEMESGRLAPAPIWSDLASFNAVAWRGVVDIVTAGFPCQPASVAGPRKGTADARWLWPMVACVVEHTAAPVVFLENVPGLRTKGLFDVLEDLAAMGFDAEWCCLSAGALGAPHRRERLWILAYRDGDQLREQSRGWGWKGGKGSCFFGEEGQGLGHAHRAGLPLGEGVGGDARPELAAAQRAGDEVGDPYDEQGDGPLPQRKREAAKAGPELGDSLRPWPPGPDCTNWPESEPQPAICREAHGGSVPLGIELRMLGNGVVPVVAAYAFRTLVRRALEGS